MNVLLIEDEYKVASFIKNGLEEEGYKVDLAEDGKKGLEKVTSSIYDIVLLDLMIPEIDGLEVLKRMRAQGIETPVLVITAKDSKEDIVRGLESGSDDYLTKPFSFEELLARIKALLRRSRRNVLPLIRYGSLILDAMTRKLRTAKGDVDLTEKEFHIMEFFMKNKERPVSRKEIAEYVWHDDLESSNIVDVYINFLRKKIEFLSPQRRYIHTVRGIGYIFKEE